MRRISSSLLFLAAVLLLSAACRDAAVSTAPVPLTVTVTVPEEPKMITYDGSVSAVSGEIDRAHVTIHEGSGTSGEVAGEGDIYLAGGQGSAVIMDVIPGIYTVAADGYSGTAQITHDAAEYLIVPSSSEVSIALSSFADKPAGSVSVTVSDSGNKLTAVSYPFTWKMMGGEGFAEEMYSGSGSFSAGVPFTITAASGSFRPGRYIYTMSFEADTGTETLVSAMRLLPGLPAAGTIEYAPPASADDGLTLIVTNSIGDVIDASWGGTAVSDGTYTITVTGVSASPSEVYLYLNGETAEIASESYSGGNLTLTTEITESGVYDILVVIVDGNLSGVGSVQGTVAVNRPALMPKPAAVVGVAWDYGDPDTELYRLYTSAEAAAAAKSAVGRAWDDPHDLVTVDIMEEPVSSYEGKPGSSPFDELGPWKDMKLVAMKDGGEVLGTIEDGESIESFVNYYNDGTVDFMVCLPDAYLRVIDDPESKIRYYYVSDEEFEGSSLQPASGHYIGRYDGYIQEQYNGTSDDKLWSQPSGTSTATEFAQSLTHQEAYDVAHNRVSTVPGKIYGGLIWEEVSYVQLMYLVEYADMDSQTVLGVGNLSSYYSAYTDRMPYHSGVLTDKSKYSYSKVQYRYIEGLFGCDIAGDLVENLLIDGPVMYMAPDEKSLTAAAESGIFSDKGSGDPPPAWIAIGSLPSISGSDYITAMNYEETYVWSIGVPSAASGGSGSTYVSDYLLAGSTLKGVLKSVRLSGISNATSTIIPQSGAWCLNCFMPPADSASTYSARLSFR